jgi:hypothetical protein
MTLELDLTGVEAWEGGAILPPGTYTVEVDDAKEGTSTGGHPQLELQLRAIGGDQAGGEIRDWIIVTPQSAGRVKQMLSALEVAGLDGKVRFEASDLVGKRCKIVVRTEQYDGKDRSRVKAYETLGGEPAGATTGNSAPSVDDPLPF